MTEENQFILLNFSKNLQLLEKLFDWKIIHNIANWFGMFLIVFGQKKSK